MEGEGKRRGKEGRPTVHMFGFATLQVTAKSNPLKLFATGQPLEILKQNFTHL